MLQTSISRKIYFSSGHRYAVDHWSEDQNKKAFGSCYSPHGHGHNYILEATFSGSVNPDTGMILDLREIDRILKTVTNELDHRFLNTDIDFFKTSVPTTENVASYLVDKILKLTPDHIRLTSIRLYESEDLWVDIKL